jgi:predicted secreted protein
MSPEQFNQGYELKRACYCNCDNCSTNNHRKCSNMNWDQWNKDHPLEDD